MSAAIIHIGAEKTGSTSIQSLLAKNRQWLARHGVLYPAALGKSNHVKMYAFASDGGIDEVKTGAGLLTISQLARFRSDLHAELKVEITKHSPARMIISNEHLSSRLLSPAEIDRVRNFVGEFADDIAVLIYIRRQDNALLSSYSTYVRTGGTDEIEYPAQSKIDGKYDYAKIISRWREIFGPKSIRVRRFGREYLPDGDVIKDFVEAADLSSIKLQPIEARNRALGRAAIELLRLINRDAPPFIDNRHNPLRGNLVELIERYSDDRVFVPRSDIPRRLFESLRESNETVRAEYFPGSSSLFNEDNTPLGSGEEVTFEELGRLVSFLWIEKQRQVIKLRMER